MNCIAKIHPSGQGVTIKRVPRRQYKRNSFVITPEQFAACGNSAAAAWKTFINQFTRQDYLETCAANKAAAAKAQAAFENFVTHATGEGFMLLEDFRGLERQMADPALNDPAGLNEDRDFERMDFSGKGEVELMFQDMTTTRAQIKGLMLGYDNVRYLTFKFYDDTSIGEQTGPREFMVPIYKNSSLAIRRLA